MAAFLKYVSDRGIDMHGFIGTIPDIRKKYQRVSHNLCFGKTNRCHAGIKERSLILIIKSGHQKIIRDRVAGFFGGETDANGNVWSDANLATALGGITKGVTNVELCASYAAIANGGNYIKPIYYTKILDHNGNVLIENTSAERSVIKESTAYLLTSAMEDVVKKGTGTACQLDNMAVAGKTGTTEAYNDLWFVGYTPYYTCAVWSGYDNNEKLPDYARNFHKKLWKKVMTRIHEGLPSKEFDKPASVEKLSVCSETGLLPRAGCPVITEYFDVGTMPTEYCDQHFYDSDYYEYDNDYDNSSDSSDQQNGTDADNNADNNGTDNNGDSGDNSDNGGDNSGDSDNNGDDNGDSDNTDNGGGGDADPSYQVDYY